MKRLYIFLIPVLLLAACGPASSRESLTRCEDDLKAMEALKSGLRLPAGFQTENPVKSGGEFDVMEYFTVLDHLSMEPGFVLDYVYHFDGMGGYPVLYAHPSGQAPFSTEADLSAVEKTSTYLDYIQVDDTPEGYFQFVLLASMGNQFYLDWHANYNDDQFVCDKAGVREIIDGINSGGFGQPMPIASRLKASLLPDLAPAVSLNGDTAKVQVVIFTKWGGFYQRTYTIDRSAPHTILDIQEKNILPYDCGVMF